MIEVEWWDYESADELAEAVAGDAAFIVESAIDGRGQALVALPADALALPAIERLAQAKLDWKRVTVIPTDDRLVAVDSPLSNAAALARAFLPKGARVLPITAAAAADHHAAGKAADARLAELQWPPDLVWLGMGADGHTASIYPGPDLEAALDAPKGRRAVGVMPDPLPDDAPVARVTLTRRAILSARTILVTVEGAAARKLLTRAIKEGPLSTLPIGRVLAEAEQPIDIHWLA